MAETAPRRSWPETLRPADQSPTVSRAPRFGLLLVAASLSFAVQGAIPPGRWQQVVVTALAAACLLLALRAAQLSERGMRAALGIVIVALAGSVLHAAGAVIGEGSARIMNAALLILGPPAVAIGVLRDLRRSRRVHFQTVMGVLSLYLLVGLLYGFVFRVLDVYATPFFSGGDAATTARCLYYSFTTLATVGYGDLVARSDLGHTLSVSEALLGQIYLVTVVSLVVSNLGQPAREPRR